MDFHLTRRLAAEVFGTFCLVLIGTGAIVTDDLGGGVVTHVGVALTFGLVVLVMICTVGNISGAHLNPAVTLGFCLAGRFDGKLVLPYAASQCVGAVLASLLLHALFPTHATLGGTVPAGPALQSFILEVVITLILMFVILTISAGQEELLAIGMVVGSVIVMAALFAGPVSGASMNPARSLGPALVSQRFDGLWIYLTAPFLGAMLAVLLHRLLHGPRRVDA